VPTPLQNSPARLLTRHFLDNLLHNDLISPDADRHAILAVVAATICSVTLFVTAGLSLRYLVQFIQLPGFTAVAALSDRSLLLGGSMIVTALVTLLVWEHLSVDPRDSLILGHLPIPTSTIVRAKLAALVMFVAVFAIAVNLVPSVVYPAFLIANLPLRLGDLARLIVVHASTALMAAAFGFFSVFAIRGVLRLVLGASGFRRASAAVHSTLTTVAAIALLLLPLWASNVERTELPPGGSPFDAPPLWFLGVYEVAAGEVVLYAPLEIPEGTLRPSRFRDADQRGRERYRSLQPTLRSLALIAGVVLPIVAIAAVATYYATNRRLPLAASTPASFRTTRALVARALSAIAPRNPTARASFFFTLETLGGSPPHRLSLVVATALGVTTAVVTASANGPSRWLQSAALPRGAIAAELMLLAALVLGFRHSVRVPAELPANWIVQLSWNGDRLSFVSGVKRSALWILLLPLLAVFFALNALFFNPVDAAGHLTCSLAALWLLLEVTLLGYNKLPFTAALAPGRHVRVRGLFIFAAALLGCRGFATFEHRALSDPRSLVTLIAVLVAGIALVRLADRRSAGQRPPVEFAEPAHPLLEVGLGDLVGRG
jgi:hypothetical protein